MRTRIAGATCLALTLACSLPAEAAQWVFAAKQYTQFDAPQPAQYRFGSGSRWTYKVLPAGRQYCFFDPDPAKGTEKVCERLPAPVYYFSSCDAGAQPGCVAGDNGNDGKSPASPKRDFTGFSFKDLPEGALVLLARGGAWAANKGYVTLDNANATADQRIVIGAYTPSWGGSKRPLYVHAPSAADLRDGNLFAFIFKCGSTPGTPCGNYIIENIEFVGTHPSAKMFWTWFAIDNVTWRNDVVRGGGAGIFVDDNSTIQRRSSNIQITGNTVTGMRGMGIFVKADGARVVGNHFIDNATGGSALDHHLYLSCAGAMQDSAGCSGGLVSGNDFEDTTSAGTGTMLLQHGLFKGLVVENNLLRNTAVAANGAYGISLSLGEFKADVEGCVDCIVRDNTIVDVGGVAIDLEQVRNVSATNNTIVYTRPSWGKCFVVGDWKDGQNDIAQNGVHIVRNSCYIAAPREGATGIFFHHKGTEGGAGHELSNNLIYMGYPVDAQNSYCYDVDVPAARFVSSGSNACFGRAANTALTTGVQAQWTSVSADPQIVPTPTVDDPSVLLAPGSPAQGKGAQ